MTQSFRIRVENICILILGFLSLGMFALSFFHHLPAEAALLVSTEMDWMVQRASSVVLLCLCMQLWKRKHAARVITQALLLLDFVSNIPHVSDLFSLACMGSDVILFLVFFWFRSDFCCPASKTNRKRGFLILLLSLVGVTANAVISYHYLTPILGGGQHTLLDSFEESLDILLGNGASIPVSHGAHMLELVMFWFSWACILAALLYAVRPWLTPSTRRESDLQHARTLLNLYSQNSCSYLALEDDKQLYFGRNVDGVIPYGVVGDTIIVNGDPVCADLDFPVLLAEFKEFCEKSAHKLFFLSVTDHFLEEYKRQGFGYVKCGEEARFSLADYEISGKKGAKMRMNINHAKKAGVTVLEYSPLEQRNQEIENAFERVTNEWLGQKKSSLLAFTMGKAGLDNPMDKRYFYATDADRKIVAFIAFVPFLGKDGYMADVTRHGNDAPSGVMETIIYEAFQTFRSEGIHYGSLGVAPLAGLDDEKASLVERLLRFVYNNLNDCYGFKDLYRAKEKYSPTEWIPAYYIYLPKHPTPDMFYAVVKIQNPNGIREGLQSFLKGKLHHEEHPRNDPHKQREDQRKNN